MMRPLVIKTDVLHCFGFEKRHKLTVDEAYELLCTARNPWITLYYDERDPKDVNDVRDFAIGHAGLRFGEFKDRYGDMFNVLLTTDKAKNAEQAVRMADKGVSLFGRKIKVKLEVLDKDDKRPINAEVIEAAKTLRHAPREYSVWPIINYDEDDIIRLAGLGAEAVRVMRGPIGCSGTVKDIPDIRRLGRLGIDLKLPIILEGGIGDEEQVFEALTTPGIDAVLVNSCLFKSIGGRPADPKAMMEKIRLAADEASKRRAACVYRFGGALNESY